MSRVATDARVDSNGWKGVAGETSAIGQHRLRVRFPPIVDVRLRHQNKFVRDNTSPLWSRGCVVGAVASTLLLAYFIIPPVWQITHGPCDIAPTCPPPIARDVIFVLGVLGVYCLLAGFFIGRSVDRAAQEGRSTAVAFLVMLGLFGGLLWVMIQAAFW